MRARQACPNHPSPIHDSTVFPIQRVLSKALKSIMITLGCLHMAGGPLALLQIMAWASMLATYSLENGIVQGAVDTFSGERPCPLCQSIASAKNVPDESSEPRPALPTAQMNVFQELMIPRIVRVSPLRGIQISAVFHADPLAMPGRGRAAPMVPPPLDLA